MCGAHRAACPAAGSCPVSVYVRRRPVGRRFSDRHPVSNPLPVFDSRPTGGRVRFRTALRLGEVSLVFGVPVRMIGFFGVVESNQRQQEEPRGHAEGAGQCGDAHGIEQGVHACLDEKRNDDAQNGPYGRTDVRFVEDRSQRDGRQHGAESVETFGDVGSRCLEDEGCEERQRRSDGRPQRGPAVREPETGEEQNARYPVVDEKDCAMPLSQ